MDRVVICNNINIYNFYDFGIDPWWLERSIEGYGINLYHHVYYIPNRRMRFILPVIAVENYVW